MTKIIGLTGGIGSGKLRLQIIFNLWNPRLYSGRRSEKLMQTPDVQMY
jgi:dephospho-CoA kinase